MSTHPIPKKSELIIQTQKLQPFKRVAEFGFNTCHAPVVMRSDLQEQMARCHRELGMKYWRCHGTLSDDMGVVVQGKKGQVDYSFSGLRRVLDAGLRCGVKPFLEFSFLPSALALEPRQNQFCHYQAIASRPDDFRAWGCLIEKTVRFLLETYGERELKTWYFEVWNEPNIPFWKGTREEYFLLYRETVLALKRTCSALRVGGPATARADWITSLLEFCRETRTPIDYISAHIYPSDLKHFPVAEGETPPLKCDFLRGHFQRVRREVDAFDPKLPVFWGEWNSSAGPLDHDRDDVNNAALICSALAGMEEYSEGSLFWNLSDIYEECGFHFAPFHGGYGMYTVDGIPKSAARAFEFWHRMFNKNSTIQGLPLSAANGAFATTDEVSKTSRVILWNHREIKRKTAPWNVELQMDVVTQPKADVCWILPGKGSAYEKWTGWDCPINLSPSQCKDLEKASVPARSSLKKGKNGFSLILPAGSVALVELKSAN